MDELDRLRIKERKQRMASIHSRCSAYITHEL
jgi:hypothetical protein